MLLETVRSALERRGYDVTSAEPSSADGDLPNGWRQPDVVAEGDDDVVCWVVDQVSPSNVLRAQAAARQVEAQAALYGDDVSDDARPWARRYDVELLDPSCVDDRPEEANGNGANGGSEATASDAPSNGSPAANGNHDGVDAEALLGAAPPLEAADQASNGNGGHHACETETALPQTPLAPDEEESGEDGPDAVGLLDPEPSRGDADPASDEDAPSGDNEDPPGPPSWLAARPTPWSPTPPSADEAEDGSAEPAEEGPHAPAADEPDDPAPALAGAPPTPPSERGADQGSGETPDPAETEPAAGDEARDGPSNGHLPWEPAGEDPPTPPRVEGDEDVNPPGTPLDDASPGGAAGEDEEPEALAPGASLTDGDAPEPSPAGSTSLDALVEAASQSPHPNADVPADDGAPAGAGPEPTSQAPAGDAGSTVQEGSGAGEPERSASTDPAKIAQDVMREVEAQSEADGSGEAEAGDRPGADGPASGGAARIQAPDEASPDPDEPGTGTPAPAGSPEDAGPSPEGAAFGDDGPQPVGEDDAAMRRHDPGLWGTSGRLDDVRTSLRDHGDSPHARARENNVSSGWLDDLDGDA